MKIEMKDIYKSFGKNDVLKGVDFTLNDGEIHALVGENGAGKSTLMNILSGVLSKDKGEILIDGKEVAKECVNKAFLGAKISKGQHQIRIIFKAPMKNVGYVCSGVGFIWLVFQGRRKKNEKGFERIN